MGISFFELALAKRGVGTGGGGSGGGGGGGGGGGDTELLEKVLKRTVTGTFQSDDLTSVGNYALSYCTGLTSIVLPKCQTVSNGAFRNCDGVTSVTIPKASLIGADSFTNCSSLPTITIGENATGTVTIEASAFKNCFSLASVYLKSSTVCTLGASNAFSNTPIESTQYTGSYGKIYVPANLVNAYKSASNWSLYASRIEAY